MSCRERQNFPADLNNLNDRNAALRDPQIQAIRNRFLRMNGIFSSPGIQEWRGAVRDAATAIAQKYFPGSACPLEEAALGPLLERCRFWITSIYETEKLPVVRRLHRIRLETLHNLRPLTGPDVGSHMSSTVTRIWNWYGVTKWPQSLLGRLREGSTRGIAMRLGWLVIKATLVNFLCRYSFDGASRELDTLYRDSCSFL